MTRVPAPGDTQTDADILETPLTDSLVFHGALIDVTHMTVRLPNGKQALREVVRHRGAAAVVPVDLYIPGCPPHPITILDGLLRLLGRLDETRT